MPTHKLNSEEITAALHELPGWKHDARGRLAADFEFKTFGEAFSFMTRVAFEADRMNHHPDWTNSYNKVHVELTTHDSGGITEKDLKLARKISEIDWT
jgi:4a-hydroxytetrahydrobiopterin dehydratase